MKFHLFNCSRERDRRRRSRSRDRDRHRYHHSSRRRDDSRERRHRRKSSQEDKYVGSFSEGMKKHLSSDSENEVRFFICASIFYFYKHYPIATSLSICVYIFCTISLFHSTVNTILAPNALRV